MDAVQKSWLTPKLKTLFNTTIWFSEVERSKGTKWSINSQVLVRSTRIISPDDDTEHTRLDIIELLKVTNELDTLEIKTIHLDFKISEIYMDLDARLMFAIEDDNNLMG